jgi:hypothetical protein
MKPRPIGRGFIDLAVDVLSGYLNLIDAGTGLRSSLVESNALRFSGD